MYLLCGHGCLGHGVHVNMKALERGHAYNVCICLLGFGHAHEFGGNGCVGIGMSWERA